MYGPTCSVCGKEVGARRCKGMCSTCYHRAWNKSHPQARKDHGKSYYQKHRKDFLTRTAARNKARRIKMLDDLGGKCACCGERNKIFLCLDHIKGGGRREHSRKGGAQGVWKRAIKDGLPKDRYRVLCWNCNAALGLYGFCPHSKLTSPTFHGKHVVSLP